MAFDLIWVTQYLTGGGKNAANISQISRASRAARLGTRTVKLIRLIRMLKLLKQMKTLSSDIAKDHKKMMPKKSQRISRMQ
jgi:class 3 adenylate cyclase